MDSINTLDVFTPGGVYSWAEVSQIHRVRNGIYQKGGRLISLLTDFGRINPCYPDAHGHNDSVIHYTGSGRHGDQKLDPANRALMAASESGIKVPLFNKLAPGQWQFLGMWSVSDPHYDFDRKQNRMLWKFKLELEPSA